MSGSSANCSDNSTCCISRKMLVSDEMRKVHLAKKCRICPCVPRIKAEKNFDNLTTECWNTIFSWNKTKLGRIYAALQHDSRNLFMI